MKNSKANFASKIKGIYNVEGNVETPITGIAADSRENRAGKI